MAPPLALALVPPTAALRESFLEAARAFQAEGLPWWIGGDLPLAEQDFAAFVARRLAEAHPADPARVPKTHLWAVVDGAFVGRIGIHHRLDEALRRVGGHIGYDTAPAWRGRGVATEMLRQALPVARGLGLARVLLTCDDGNAASIRVIERNGGVLHQTRDLGGTRKRSYTIDLAAG